MVWSAATGPQKQQTRRLQGSQRSSPSRVVVVPRGVGQPALTGAPGTFMSHTLALSLTSAGSPRPATPHAWTKQLYTPPGSQGPSASWSSSAPTSPAE